LLVQALQLGDKSGDSTPGQQDDNTPSARSSTCFFKFCSRSANHNITASPNLSTPTTPVESQDPGSPAAFLITNDQDLANTNGEAIAGDEMDGPSAADYDPTVDMREDRQRNDLRHNDEVSSGAYDETLPTTEQDVLLPTETAEVEEKPKKSKDDFDMFAEDDDDMFAEDPVPNGKPHAAISDDVAKAVPIPPKSSISVCSTIGMILKVITKSSWAN